MLANVLFTADERMIMLYTSHSQPYQRYDARNPRAIASNKPRDAAIRMSNY